MSLFAWIVVGLLAGAIARRITGTDSRGCLDTLVVGVLGAFLGGGLYRLARGGDADVLDSFDLGSIAVATLGACGLLLVLQAVGRRS